MPVVINAEMAGELFPNEDPIGKNLAPERQPGDEASSSPTGPGPGEERVVGVVAAYREDGEIDGQAWQALYRKPLVDTDPSKRENRPPGNLILRMRPGTPANFEEPLIEHLRGAARSWSFEVKPMSEARASMIAFAAAPVAAIGLVAGFLMLMVALGLTGVCGRA